MSYKQYFKNKKITLMGLGLLGRGVGVARFLAEFGTELLITDLKSKKELKSSLTKLKKYKNIKYVLGKHRLEDFRNRDMVIKAAGVPLDSLFVAEARKKGIPVEMDASLFAKLSPATIVGVTGTRGKSTVTHLLYQILKKAGKRVYLGGNVRGIATLPLLKKAKKRDIILMELDSWQLHGFGDAKISPHVAIFTNFMEDHLNYYGGSMSKYFKDKSNIFVFQKKTDYLIAGPSLLPRLAKFRPKVKSIIIKPASIPAELKIKLEGRHNRENAALAIAAAKVLKIPDALICKAIEEFRGVPGRLELIHKIKGILIYNDTTATSPSATIAGLRALHGKGPIILIAGGTDKNLPLKELVEEIGKHSKTVIFLPGTGTDRIQNSEFKIQNFSASNLKEAVKKAISMAKRNDIILFSPAFASFGLFKNEFDRGEQFNEIVSRLVLRPRSLDKKPRVIVQLHL